MRSILQNLFNEKQRARIRRICNLFLSIIYANDLNKLAIIWKTDKWNKHWYTQHYQNHFKNLRKKKLKILEIGVGGYEIPDRGGNSLRMWKNYFRNSQIFALDIYDKKALQENRITIFQGSQTDEHLLKSISDKYGPFDIIIDDGSHINEHVITTFNILFPLLKENGIYVAEDLETSYWNDYGGDSIDLVNSKTSINFFKTIIDSINHKEFIRPGYKPTYFDNNITAIHFYHNIAFICKGNNSEKSVNIIDNKYHRTEIE